MEGEVRRAKPRGPRAAYTSAWARKATPSTRAINPAVMAITTTPAFDVSRISCSSALRIKASGPEQADKENHSSKKDSEPYGREGCLFVRNITHRNLRQFVGLRIVSERVC